MASIQDRLKKVPPFEDDIPLIQELKNAAEQQVSQPDLPPDPEEEVEEVEDKVEESQEEVQEEAPKEEKKVSERTKKQFDKLKEHNKQLSEENKKLYKNVMESLKPEEAKPQEFTPELYQQIDKSSTELKKTEVEDIYANLITKDELGNPLIDPDLLLKTLRQANEDAKQARLEAESANKRANEAEKVQDMKFRDFEESREVRRVHKKYPQINPKNKDFNELFWDDVRKEIATAPILRGENVSFMDAADKIWNARYAPQKEVEEVKKKDREKMEKTEDAKRNINASVPTTSFVKDYYSKTEDEALRQATIIGKKGALAERLKRSGY